MTECAKAYALQSAFPCILFRSVLQKLRQTASLLFKKGFALFEHLCVVPADGAAVQQGAQVPAVEGDQGIEIPLSHQGTGGGDQGYHADDAADKAPPVKKYPGETGVAIACISRQIKKISSENKPYSVQS